MLLMPLQKIMKMDYIIIQRLQILKIRQSIPYLWHLNFLDSLNIYYQDNLETDNYLIELFFQIAGKMQICFLVQQQQNQKED
ncbi:unnamed protein product [Paramecium primaurelia]|uniref:Uncharacterized protein n=1 Tax=Paramecium primaurelia TaxID=5886 RepID=A0A8S1K215_PARPR|nr:unnamed protein product [Paramecium primaurelia]